MAKKISLYGIFITTAMVVGYIDTLIPIPIPIPGVKLGLANIVTVIILYCIDFKSAFYISLLRVVIIGILFTGVSALIYSSAGWILSILSMNFFKKKEIFSITGISVIGSIMHNVGQVLLACLILQSMMILTYLILLSVTAVITGTIIGVISKYTINHMQKLNLL